MNKLSIIFFGLFYPTIVFSSIVKVSEWEGINPNTKQNQKVYVLGDFHEDLSSLRDEFQIPLKAALLNLKNGFIEIFKEKDLSNHLLIVEDMGADIEYMLDNQLVSQVITPLEEIRNDPQLIYGLSRLTSHVNPLLEVYSAEVRQFHSWMDQI